MNIRQIKALSWLGALGLGSWLGWTIYEFVDRRPELSLAISEERQRSVLDAVVEPPPTQDDLVDYDSQVVVAFRDMNWAGTAPPVTKDPLLENGPATPTYKAVATLLKVQTLLVHPDAKQSLAWVKFTDATLASKAKEKADHILRVGDHLADPYEFVEVAAIGINGMTFRFPAEAGREDELLAPALLAHGAPTIVQVGADGVILPPKSGEIQRNDDVASYNPRLTVLVGRNEFQVGWETASKIEEDYTKILSRDVAYRSYRDPRTGKVEGIEITRVSADSLPSQHGLSEGEILKSVNGHKVTSMNDLVNFVKKEAPTTDLWVAIFEKRGKEYTRTYRSPPD